MKVSVFAAVVVIASCSMSLPVSSTDSVRKAQARAMSSVEARTYNQDAMDAFSRLAPPPSMEYPIAPDADAPNAPSA